ncbi:MAG TPA: OmpH family outer membrane protein [Longimicrobiaceae bacterium]|nr:OmpH family outer membrane protein [Longimicrobiaceae bacterium]
MKRFFSFGGILAAALLAFGVSTADAQAVKIGFINSQKILAEAPGSAEAQQTLQREMGQYQTQVDSMQNELQRLQQDFERQQSTLSAQARQQRQQELQQRFTAYQQRMGQLQQTAQQREAQLVDPIMRRIRETIETIRREGGYAMIFDAANSGMVAADSTLDLTERVLVRLRGTGGR